MNKNKNILLAGLADENDYRDLCHENYDVNRKQLEKYILEEKYSLIEEDEWRLNKLIGQENEVEEVSFDNVINESAGAMLGPGFQNFKNSSYTGYAPSLEEKFSKIIGQDIEIDSKKALMQRIAQSNNMSNFVKEEDFPKFDENFNPILSEEEQEERRNNLFQQRSDLQEKIYNGEVAVMGGIGPGFEAYDGKKEIKDVYQNAISNDKKWYFENTEEDTLNILEKNGFPKQIDYPNISFHYSGMNEQCVFYESNKDSMKVKACKYGVGWHSQITDPLTGFFGEGQGESLEESIAIALGEYKPIDDHIPANLREAERTSSNAWYYRRTGNVDGDHVKFKPSKNLSNEEYGQNGYDITMHPPIQPQPSGEAYPGLGKWYFYESDPTYEKIMKKAGDPLEMGEIDAVEEFYQKFLKKYSVYK